MDEPSGTELAARIDGVARAPMGLIAQLEMSNALDGPRLSAYLRNLGASRERTHGLRAARAVLEQMADELDEAREYRRSQGMQD